MGCLFFTGVKNSLFSIGNSTPCLHLSLVRCAQKPRPPVRVRFWMAQPADLVSLDTFVHKEEKQPGCQADGMTNRKLHSQKAL